MRVALKTCYELGKEVHVRFDIAPMKPGAVFPSV